jgi:hypothetical protein
MQGTILQRRDDAREERMRRESRGERESERERDNM